MILLDTNVISEMMKQTPNKNVVKWIDQQVVTQLFISTISIAEIAYGINVLPKGNRKDLLQKSFYNLIKEAFEHRILSFNESSGHMYGTIMGKQKTRGKPMSICDGQIAAIAKTHTKSLATRNTRDFIGCELKLINPFE